MSAPAEQTRYAAEREKDSPARKYGTEGYSRVVRFIAFTKRAQGTDKTLEYDVQFVKGEVLAGNPAQPHETRMTARLAFQMHPELPMNEQDRLDNEAGMMVISYNASAD
jgi:type IV secretory pathway component VirB8